MHTKLSISPQESGCVSGLKGEGGGREGGREGGSLPSWLVPHAASGGVILPACQYVAYETLTVNKAVRSLGGGGTTTTPYTTTTAASFILVWCMLPPIILPKASLDQRPACPYPMAVAAVDELIRATREPTLRGVLTSREPRDEPGYIENPMQCARVRTSSDFVVTM